VTVQILYKEGILGDFFSTPIKLPHVAKDSTKSQFIAGEDDHMLPIFEYMIAKSVKQPIVLKIKVTANESIHVFKDSFNNSLCL